MGYRCTCCGEWDDEIPFAFHVTEPAAWLPERKAGGDSWLEQREGITLARVQAIAEQILHPRHGTR